MAHAAAADVEVSLGRSLTSEEANRVNPLLDRASLLIGRRITDLDERIAADSSLEAVVVMVEANAAARVLRNPDGVYQERIDDYSFTRDREVSSGALHITDDEWELLLTTPGTSVPSEAFTIRPYGQSGYAAGTDDDGVWTTPTDYLP